jgi:diphthamide synthase subunit DPH2
MSDDLITLNVCQSLALRRLVDALKADDSIYTACPNVVRDAFCDFYMPPYSTAEQEIKALHDDRESMLRLLDKFAHRIHDLENRLFKRNPLPANVPPPPY